MSILPPISLELLLDVLDLFNFIIISCNHMILSHHKIYICGLVQ